MAARLFVCRLYRLGLDARKQKRRPSRKCGTDGVFLKGGRPASNAARGTAYCCKPADRPHDPGDAADLSIMGYLGLLTRSAYLLCADNLLENERKSTNS